MESNNLKQKTTHLNIICCQFILSPHVICIDSTPYDLHISPNMVLLYNTHIFVQIYIN